MRRISKLSLGVGTSAFLCAWLLVLLFAIGMIQPETFPRLQFDSGSAGDMESGWRQTKFGWQDSSSWLVDSFAPRQSVELIHPLIWAFLVLTSVVGVMVWASEEWEIDRLFERD